MFVICVVLVVGALIMLQRPCSMRLRERKGTFGEYNSDDLAFQ